MTTVFLSGDKCEKIVLNCALFWAELGETVWFISPREFHNLPNGWDVIPDKEILKLITFLYICDTNDLLTKMSEIHLYPKIPRTVIILDLEYYLFPPNHGSDNLSYAAFMSASLLDGLSAYKSKYSKCAFLITASKLTNQKLRTITDLYFSRNLYNVTPQSENTVFENVVELFRNYM